MSSIVPQAMAPPLHRTIGDLQEIEYIKKCIIAMAPMLASETRTPAKRFTCSWNIVFATSQQTTPRKICAVLVQTKHDEEGNDLFSIARMGGGHLAHIEALWDLLEKMQDYLAYRVMHRSIPWSL